MSTRASAARYARALLDVVIQEGTPEQVEQELTGFAALVARTPQLQKVFANPALPVSAKRGIVEDLLARTKGSPVLAKLLLLLADRDRLSLLGELADAYRERLMEHQHVVRAEVTSAEPLPAERLAEVQRRLAHATGRQVLMTTRIDPALIGGVVTRVGSVVYDGSIATQLARIRERLEVSG